MKNARRAHARSLWFLLSTLSLLAALILWRGFGHPSSSIQSETVTLLGVGRALPAFTLQTASGHFGEAQLLGRWSLLFFGYSHCPDICPTTAMELAHLKELARAQHWPVPQLVFISVDPERDTPEYLRQYLRAFDADFVGATGSVAELEPLIRDLGALYRRVSQADMTRASHNVRSGMSSDYAIEHSSAVYVVDPQTQLRALFHYPQNADALAGEYARLTGGVK